MLNLLRVFLFCAFCSFLGAQEKGAPKASSYVLELSQQEPLSASMPSPMLEGAVGCTSDGSLVVNSILEGDSSKPVPLRTPELLSVIAPNGKVQSFDLSRIDDLQDVLDTRAYDVGDRDVVFLVYGAPKKTSFTTEPSEIVRNWYVAKFDRQGDYHGATELLLPKLASQKVGVFDTGDILLFAIDEVNREAQLVRYSPIGQKAFYYQPEAKFSKKNEMLPSAFTKGSNPDANRIDLAKLQSAVQFSQIVHYKDSILLLQMNAGAPLFQVFPNGSIRAVNLPKVDGFTADSVVPSDELLYIRYRRVGTNSGRTDDALILEIDINSGETLRRIHTGDFTIWDVACVHEGNFRVTKLKGEHTFQFFTATAKANAQ